MIELTVVEIRVSVGETAPLVVLAEVEGAGRRLPIWMSHSGASAIFTAADAQDPERPDIHQLATRLAETGEGLTRVEITGYAEGQFLAQLVLDQVVLPARPSDAIAIAMRADCPIFTTAEVMELAAVEPDQDEDATAAPGEMEFERFLEFLNTVAPEDFGDDEQT